MTDRNGTLTYVNPAFCRLYGYSPSEVVGRATPRILKGGVVAPETYATLWQRLLDKQVVTEVFVNRTKDGTLLDVESSANPILDDDGEIVGFLAVQRDATARARAERAEEALRASEARYRALAESAQDAIFIIGPDLRIQYVNRFAARAIGCAPDEAVGRALGAVFPAAIASKYERAIAGVLATGEPFYAEAPGAFVDREVMLGTQLVALRNDAGAITAVFGLSRDITDRWRAEQARRESDERFRAVTESASDAIVVANGSGKIVLWNRGAERMFLYGKDEAVGQPVGFLIPEPYHAQHVAAVQHLHATGETRVVGKTYEAVGMRKDGTRVPVEISLALWEESSGRFAGAIIRDITERKLAEEALRKREAELNEAQRVARVGSWEWTVHTSTVTWSEELYRINGLDPRLPVPPFEDMARFYTPESWVRLTAAVERAFKTGEPYEFDLQQIRTDGKGIWVSIRGEVTRDSSGQIVGLRGTVLDITDRKRAEEALRASEDRLRQAQKMEAVGQLAGGVAHDFNNLLTVVLGNASLLMETPLATSETRRLARDVIESAERGANLTRQLLAFGRRQVVRIRPLGLNELLADLLKMLGRLLGEQIAVRCNYAPDLPLIQADAGMVEQIIMNLAVNARDAMPAGGSLTISTRVVDVDSADVERSPNAITGRFVALAVSDTGDGMDPATLAHIFEPFFTTKDVGKGTGLGLATVHGIVQQHHGWVDVTSQVGQGSTFTVFLPVAADEGVADGQTPVTTGAVGGRDTILVVEDEPAVRNLAVVCLKRWGYDVLEAANGFDALRLWDEHRERIDLLLTDMVMPEGMTGRELAARLRLGRPDLKVIFSSGYSRDALDAEPELLTGDSFLPKPYTPDTLTQAVRRCLDAR